MVKKTLQSGFLIILVIGVLYIIYLREFKGSPDGLPDGYVLVSESAWDSIASLANKPPEIDSFITIIKGDPIYLDKPTDAPLPEAEVTIDTNIVTYSDSLVNDSINAWIDFKLSGELLALWWRYRPIITEITTEKLIYVPQIINNDVSVPARGLFISGVVGGNASTFSFGADLDLINRKKNIYGIQYRRMGNDNLYYFKLGVPIKNPFK